LIFGIFLFGGVNAAYSSATPQISSFGGGSSSYLAKQGINLFPTGIGENGQCGAGQDFVLQIHPLGCSPSLVTSDLLEEQNVPVFCPIVATQINPLIKINAIDSMIFSGTYPPEISGIGFHPANAAVSGPGNDLLNYPVLENVGYAVIVLNRNENESSMPDYVEGNLTAKIRYDIENAFGFGDFRTSIPIMSDVEWDARYNEFNFWQGKGFVRVMDIDGEKASVAVYEDKDRRIANFDLKVGESSRKIYLGGSYCLAGLQVKLENLENPDTKVRLKVDEDYFEVGVGEKFLENRCTVNNIQKTGLSKSTQITCKDDDSSRKVLNFEINPQISLKVGDKEKNYVLGDNFKIGEQTYYITYLDLAGKSTNENLIVWIASLDEADTKKYVNNGKLNSRGIDVFYENVISKQEEDFTKGKVSNKNVWKLVYGSNNYANVNVDVKGFAKLGGTGEEGVNNACSDAQDWCPHFLNAVNLYSEESVNIIKEGKEVKYSEPGLLFYKNIGQVDKYSSQISGLETYTEKGIKEGIELAMKVEDYARRDNLIRILLDNFNTKANQLYVENKINNYYLSNSAGLRVSESIYISGQHRDIEFVDIYQPGFEDYGVELQISGTGDKIRLSKNSPSYLFKGKIIELVELKENEVKLSTNIESTEQNSRNIIILKQGEVKSFVLEEGEIENKYSLKINKINLNKVAKVSVLANIDRTGTDANISFKIGIEKRAIDLSPERIEKMIDSLNESLVKWEERSEKLGNVVDGLQKACIVTAGVLTVKNLFLQAGGQVKARKQTMEDIRVFCKKTDKYKGDIQDCINQKGELIDQLQKTNEKIVKEQDARSKEIKENLEKKKLEEGQNYDTEFKKEYIEVKGYQKELDGQFVSIDEMMEYDSCKQRLVKDSYSTGVLKEKCEDVVKKYETQVSEAKAVENARLEREGEIGLVVSGVPSVLAFAPKNAHSGIWSGQTTEGSKISNEFSGEKNVQFVTLSGEDYVLVLADNPDAKGRYSVTDAYKYQGLSGGSFKGWEKSDTLKSKFIFTKAGQYKTPINNPQVRYFGAAPDKDFPAIVPFPYPSRENNGYYVGVRHKTVTGQYAKSGEAKSYYVCNAMDGEIDFNPENQQFMGGDKCIGVNLVGTNLVTSQKAFGLSEAQTKDVVSAASRAINEAQRKVGSSAKGSILGMDVNFGDAVFSTPQMQCQDFMSPTDCAWLFNLCDPVICPASRCDFGGAMPVADPIQSGIIGSLILCLPNFKIDPMKGVLMPVCLTGLKAGMDGYISVVKSHRDCLIEKKETGKTVGICDEVYSYNLCQLFWQQVAPLKDLLIPKLLQLLTGGGLGRGGGEYTNAAAAWQNARDSLSFFTQNYATTAYQTFKVQAVDELQNEVCKNSISSVIPEIGVLNSMVEPSSPPQFHAKFDEVLFTDATVPPISKYKVFYHVFAGKSSGVSYQVYLKASSEGISLYKINPTYVVNSGFIPLGESATETKDFTAPTGYVELCVRVNNQEECGFKQVTTSLALDYLNDQFVQNEVENTEIKTEVECISGGNNIYSFVSPNLQGGATEFANPDISQRGITRVCSSGVPDGLVEEMSKWVRVGYCDDTNLGCWIDKDSVENAITFAGAEEETLSKLSSETLNRLAGGSMNIEAYNNNVEKVKLNIAEIEKSGDRTKETQTVRLIEQTALVSTYFTQVPFDWQKAELTYLKARIYDVLTRLVYNKESGESQGVAPLTDKEKELINAAKEDNIDKVRSLIEDGANVNAKDNEGFTALFYALELNYFDIVNSLIDNGADVNTNGKGGVTPLIYASFYGYEDFVNSLIEKGVDNFNAQTDVGMTALIHASRQGYENIAQLLIEKGADVNVKDDKGNTALMYAKDGGYENIVQLLIDNGAESSTEGEGDLVEVTSPKLDKEKTGFYDGDIKIRSVDYGKTVIFKIVTSGSNCDKISYDFYKRGILSNNKLKPLNEQSFSFKNLVVGNYYVDNIVCKVGGKIREDFDPKIFDLTVK